MLRSAIRSNVWIKNQEPANIKTREGRRMASEAMLPRPIVPKMRWRGSRPEGGARFRPRAPGALNRSFAQQIVGKSEHEEHDGFSDRADDPGGGNKDSNSLLGASFQIDVVIANAANARSRKRRDTP